MKNGIFKSVIAVLMVFVILLTAASCSADADTPSSSGEETETIRPPEEQTTIRFDPSNLVPGLYNISIQPYYLTETRDSYTVDESCSMIIELLDGKGSEYRTWARQYWGSVRLNDIKII